MLEESLEKPVFGHGQTGGLNLINDGLVSIPLSPHNAFVHIFHAWGGPGLLAFSIGFLPFIVRIQARFNTNQSVAWPALILLLALLLTSLLDLTLFFNQSLFFGVLGIAIPSSVPAKPKPAAKAF
mgnify:FL=1